MMDSPFMIAIETEIFTLYSHHSYENARFIASTLPKSHIIINQILDYFCENHYSSISCKTNTYTSKYYEALAHIKLKNIKNAIRSLVDIVNRKFNPEVKFGNSFDHFLLSEKFECVYELLGGLYSSIGDKSNSKLFYSKAAELNMILKKTRDYFQQAEPIEKLNTSLVERILKPDVVFKTIENPDKGIKSFVEQAIEDFELFGKENEAYLPENHKKEVVEGDFRRQRVFTDMASGKSKNSDIQMFEYVINEYFRDLKKPIENLEKYKRLCPGLGSYFITEAAAILSNENNCLDMSIGLFEYVQKSDQFFLNNLGVFSTELYKKKDKARLSLLCKDLIRTNPGSFVTFTCLGNYYSLLRDYKKSAYCLKKSLSLNLNFYTASILGHEYIQTKEYAMAQIYFNLGILLNQNNYNAYIGLGLCNYNLNDRQISIYYFRLASKLNPKNQFVKYFLVKYLLRCELTEETLSEIEGFLHIDSTNYGLNSRLETLYNHLEPIKYFNSVEELILVECCKLMIEFRSYGHAEKLLSKIHNKDMSYERLMDQIRCGIKLISEGVIEL